MRTAFNIKHINNLLLALIIIVNLYTIGAPFAPQLFSWWQLNHTSARADLTRVVSAPVKTVTPTQNRLVIPDIALDTPLGEGTFANRYEVLKDGVWRYSRGSDPAHGSNTVLIGHRFTYTKPRGIFYSLDKVRLGSTVAIFWNNQRHIYRVSEVKTVDASETSIQNKTSRPTLTLFTCTPLWHPTQRLVVTAEEVSS